MKVNAEKFLNHINKISLGGLVNEVVLDKDFKFVVTDESKGVVSWCRTKLSDNSFGDIGIYDLVLFTKAVQYAKETIFSGDNELMMDVVDNRLVFKKFGNEFTFLLSDARVISNTVDNPEKILDFIQKSPKVSLKVSSILCDKCLKVIQLITPETCSFEVKNGRVYFKVGKSTEHNAVVDLGDAKSEGTFSVVFTTDFIVKVFSVLAANTEAFLELRPEMPLLVDIVDYLFMITPCNNAKKEEK